MSRSHAVLLTGSSLDTSTEALKRSHGLLGGHNEHLKHIVPDEKGTISIKQIEELQKFLSLKVPGKAEVRRTIIIEQADSMGVPAQNALLKTLEEPPKDTVIFLTSARSQDLLPTIRSRTQIEHIRGDESAPESEAVQLVKQALAGKAYDRLIMIDGSLKQKETAKEFVSTLATVAQASLKVAATKKTGVARWQKILQAAYTADDALDKNANAKLTLTELMLSL